MMSLRSYSYQSKEISENLSILLKNGTTVQALHMQMAPVKNALWITILIVELSDVPGKLASFSILITLQRTIWKAVSQSWKKPSILHFTPHGYGIMFVLNLKKKHPATAVKPTLYRPITTLLKNALHFIFCFGNEDCTLLQHSTFWETFRSQQLIYLCCLQFMLHCHFDKQVNNGRLF